MGHLIVHHLQVSQSERIPWLCEELGLDYELRTYKRSPLAAPPEYKALHPQQTAPIIQDEKVILAESAACIEYICHKFAGGKLFVKPEEDGYADFLYWFHYGNGFLQAALSKGGMARLAGMEDANDIIKAILSKIPDSLEWVNQQLGRNEYLAGKEFTAADVMSFWCFTNMRYWYGYSLQDYPNIHKYVQRISQRPAYKTAMKKSDPDLKPALDIDAPEPFFTLAKPKA